jgi:hypothetical protein
MESALMINYPNAFNSSLDISEYSAMYNTPYGCQGGYSNVVMNAAADKGVTVETIWPYKSSYYNAIPPANYSTYMNDTNLVAKPIGKTVTSSRNNSVELKSFVDIQPTVIYLNSDNSLSYYKGGYYNSTSCNPNWYTINHAVVVVGYDMINKYWLVRNSWGATWGENGYVRMAMWNDGTSGLCNMYYWGGMRNGIGFTKAFGAGKATESVKPSYTSQSHSQTSAIGTTSSESAPISSEAPTSSADVSSSPVPISTLKSLAQISITPSPGSVPTISTVPPSTATVSKEWSTSRPSRTSTQSELTTSSSKFEQPSSTVGPVTSSSKFEQPSSKFTSWVSSTQVEIKSDSISGILSSESKSVEVEVSKIATVVSTKVSFTTTTSAETAATQIDGTLYHNTY